MLRRLFWVCILMLAVFLVMPASLAVPLDAVPNPQQVKGGWVSDLAELLSDSTEARINQLVSKLNEQTGGEVVVVTVPETTPSISPQQFAIALFHRWQMDEIGENPSVLFLISKRDRCVEIRTSWATARFLSNSRVSSIINLKIMPQFKHGRFDAGTLAGTQALIDALQSPHKLPNLSLTRLITSPIPLAFKGLLLLAIILGFRAIATVLVHSLEPKLNDLTDDQVREYGEYFCKTYRPGSYDHSYYGDSGSGTDAGGGCSGGGAGGSW